MQELGPSGSITIGIQNNTFPVLTFYLYEPTKTVHAIESLYEKYDTIGAFPLSQHLTQDESRN